MIVSLSRWEARCSERRNSPHMNDDFDPTVSCLAAGRGVRSNGLGLPAADGSNSVLGESTFDKVSDDGEGSLSGELPVVFPF